MTRQLLTAKWSLATAMAVALLTVACAEPDPKQSAAADTLQGGNKDAKAADVAGSDAFLAEDEPGLRLLAKARSASGTASQAPWPTSAEAIWPGFALHNAPTALVILNAKGMARRAYLFGFDSPPASAQAVVLSGVAEPIWRYDDATAEMGPGETVIAERQVADASALVVTWSANRDTDDTIWMESLGRGYMNRLRDMEAGWTGVQACGQTIYPRFEEAIALFLVECAVLSEALQATDVAVTKARLHEWAAARAAAIDVTNFVGLRTRHYDNIFGSERFVAGRLSVAAGLRNAGQWNTVLRDWLALPATVPVPDFDTLLMDNGEVSAAAIEAASGLGWDVEPNFSKGENVYQVVMGQLGSPPSTALDTAKARLDWSGYVKRAKAIMALPRGS